MGVKSNITYFNTTKMSEGFKFTNISLRGLPLTGSLLRVRSCIKTNNGIHCQTTLPGLVKFLMRYILCFHLHVFMFHIQYMSMSYVYVSTCVCIYLTIEHTQTHTHAHVCTHECMCERARTHTHTHIPGIAILFC